MKGSDGSIIREEIELAKTLALTSRLTSQPVRERALQWLKCMRVGPVSYRMNEGASANAFTSCFALFILDLLGETRTFAESIRCEWIAYLQSLQNQVHGYFEPEIYCHDDAERNRLQLTCFCLSALGILGAGPKFPLKYLDEFKSAQDIDSYLHCRNVHMGARGSGNKAMFLGIALSYEYERTREKRFGELLDAWFEFHDRHQNANGFWGSTREDLYYHGFQNALHQLVVYDYWNRPLGRQEKMVDTIIALQGPDGHFDMTPGGSACMDYDAIHFLANVLCWMDCRKSEVTATLRKAFYSLIANQNSDGGFCQSRAKPKRLGDLIRQAPYYFKGNNPYLWYYRLRKAVGVMMRPDQITTGWVPEARRWDQSNLWDTWFRLLAMAVIANSVHLENDCGMQLSRLHEVIGFGHLRGH